MPKNERSRLRRRLGRLRRMARQLRMAVTGYRNRREMVAAVLNGEGEVTAVLDDGSVLRAPECAMLLSAVAEVHEDRSYTPEGLQLEAGDLVVDIGAHIGVFAIHAARQSGGVVHAYEPSPINFGYLVGNIERNAPGRIIPHRLAVADRQGAAALFTGRHSVGHSLIASPLSEGSGAVEEIRTTTLEAIVAEVGPIDFLKLDCEGAEGLILGSASRELLRSIRKIALEYHDGWSPLDHHELASILESAGFSVEHRSEGQGRFGYLHARRV